MDPAEIIHKFGADSVRLFILSDSPPEKDVQWSDEGIEASYKFILKLWSLHNKILKHVEKDYQNKKSENLIKITNKFIKDITNNLEKFGYNIVVANIHKLYSELNKELNFEHNKEILLENYKKILICIMPIIPHFSNEALENLNMQNLDLKW